ncbi:aldolase catalytic domain-containing protein [Lysinibacillus fusiformis]|uniref:aldolase catalytic domain-containing protein n=1 Tax=Lysinibacillus fusiformis TaxID=28031 RepID=UPI0021C198D3|nr:aldolase catalytic domain-containing protein [Lysinibacillus fusiformis]UXJ69544.1 aldolase catalytic domain-containing protein [Lysinibacillus fusiformis]
MSNINILDCTLRDGGYINNWNFGRKTISQIISKLSAANIDIIECGFIDDVEYDSDKSIFNSIESLKKIIEPKNKNVLYVGMIAQPYIPIEKVSDFDGSSIDGIRLTFHENEVDEALVYAKQLIEKGYKVFIQPVGTSSYSDLKLLELVKKVNEIKPYAFYLVDTLGVMYKNDLLRMYHLLDNNLDESILVGFHSHNNLQLSFSNAQELLTLHSKREIIIDSSVFGMGRGAGNLCTELITQYINDNLIYSYDVIPLLEIYDEHLSKINNDVSWGYSIPYYLAATYMCHPNYASYLLNKQTITVKSISKILAKLPIDKRDIYDTDLIEEQYLKYQKNLIDDSNFLYELKQELKDQEILVIGPGASVNLENNKIQELIKNQNPYIISVNYIPDNISLNALFISNSKRYKDLNGQIENFREHGLVIATSNIANEKEIDKMVNYSDLLVQDELISDDSCLMLMNLLKKMSVSRVYLAGFDGYSYIKSENYNRIDLIYNNNQQELILKNHLIQKNLNLLSNFIDILFVTTSIYNQK